MRAILGPAFRRFLAGMARFAALYFRKIRSRPLAFTEIVGPSGVEAFASEVKRSEASHEDAKASTFEGRATSAAFVWRRRREWSRR